MEHLQEISKQQASIYGISQPVSLEFTKDEKGETMQCALMESGPTIFIPPFWAKEKMLVEATRLMAHELAHISLAMSHGDYWCQAMFLPEGWESEPTLLRRCLIVSHAGKVRQKLVYKNKGVMPCRYYT